MSDDTTRTNPYLFAPKTEAEVVAMINGLTTPTVEVERNVIEAAQSLAAMVTSEDLEGKGVRPEVARELRDIYEAMQSLWERNQKVATLLWGRFHERDRAAALAQEVK